MCILVLNLLFFYTDGRLIKKIDTYKNMGNSIRINYEFLKRQ